MPKLTDPLKDLQIKNAKPKAKPYKLSDGGGLYLLVTPAGGKGWRLKYRFQGVEKLLSLGTYPEVGLQEVRKQRENHKALLAKEIDPSDQRKGMKLAGVERAANNFEAVSREWLSKNKDGWAPTHYSKILGRLENDVFPHLGSKPISSITAPDLLSVIRKVESRGVLETAHRALANCGQVFRYAVATGRAERDPTGDLRRHAGGSAAATITRGQFESARYTHHFEWFAWCLRNVTALLHDSRCRAVRESCRRKRRRGLLR